MARTQKTGLKSMGEGAGLGKGGYQQSPVDADLPRSEEKVKNIRQLQRSTKPGKTRGRGVKTESATKASGAVELPKGLHARRKPQGRPKTGSQEGRLGSRKS
jgi:hypothetical protein